VQSELNANLLRIDEFLQKHLQLQKNENLRLDDQVAIISIDQIDQKKQLDSLHKRIATVDISVGQ